MNLILFISGGVGVLLIAVVFLLILPVRLVRGVALSFAFFLLTFGGNITAPGPVWQGCLVASIALLGLALMRSRAPVAGGKRFALIAAWWGYVGLGALLGGSYSVLTMILYFGLATLAAYVASSLDDVEVRMLYTAIVLTAVFQVVVGLLELTVFAEPVWGFRGGARENPFLTDNNRVQGTLGHPIPYSLLQGVAFVVAWSNPARWRQWWRLIALTSVTVGLIIGGTRSIILAVAGAVLVHVATNGKLASWARLLFVLLAGGVLLVNIDVGIVRIIEELLVSGSWSHRLGAFDSVPNLLARPPLEAWFGTGFGSELLLYDRGYMQQTYLRVVDDMFVYALGTMGIAGLVALVAMCITAFVLSGRTGKALLVLMVGMFFSFDLFVWMYTGIMFSIIVTLPKSDPPVAGLKAPEKALATLSSA
ncbi:hypothetical protein ACPPVW_10200 [Leifsonia sp. McL0607]|uniref:hypothetical protein n=1 Tax=Leifsonia sp. McL0607 TaxID=3415672 RepID=UPI003CE9A51E